MWQHVAYVAIGSAPEGLHHGEILVLMTCVDCMAQQDRAMSR